MQLSNLTRRFKAITWQLDGFNKEVFCYQSEECLAPCAGCQHQNNKCSMTSHLQLYTELFKTTRLMGGRQKLCGGQQESEDMDAGFLPLNCTDRCSSISTAIYYCASLYNLCSIWMRPKDCQDMPLM